MRGTIEWSLAMMVAAAACGGSSATPTQPASKSPRASTTPTAPDADAFDVPAPTRDRAGGATCTVGTPAKIAAVNERTSAVAGFSRRGGLLVWQAETGRAFAQPLADGRPSGASHPFAASSALALLSIHPIAGGFVLLAVSEDEKHARRTLAFVFDDRGELRAGPTEIDLGPRGISDELEMVGDRMVFLAGPAPSRSFPKARVVTAKASLRGSSSTPGTSSCPRAKTVAPSRASRCARIASPSSCRPGRTSATS